MDRSSGAARQCGKPKRIHPNRLQLLGLWLAPREADFCSVLFCPGVMVQASRAFLAICLMAQVAPSVASPLSNSLQAAARRCFESPAMARCDAVWDLSADLKEQADKNDQLSCHTSVLTVEAMVSMVKRGGQDPVHQQAALEALARDCP